MLTINIFYINNDKDSINIDFLAKDFFKKNLNLKIRKLN